jgi:hypothetical protein
VKDHLLAEEQARKTALAYAGSGGASALVAALSDPTSIANLNALITMHFGSVLLNPKSARPPGNSQIVSTSAKKGVAPGKSKLRFPDLQCTNPNCLKKGHTIDHCWAKGGGQEGRGPKNKQIGKRDEVNNSSQEVNLTKFPDEAVDATALVASSNLRHSPKIHEWILDLGATTHITPFRTIFSSYHKFSHPRPIGTANHGQLHAIGMGNAWVQLNGDNGPRQFELKNLLHALGCLSNLMSVNTLTKNGVAATFMGDQCTLFD